MSSTADQPGSGEPPKKVPAFGALLRQSRLEARLSQEELAESAGISADAVSALERGKRKIPQRQTLTAIVRALRLNGESLRAFESAASRHSSSRYAGSVRAALKSNVRPTALPVSLSAFFGRHTELDELAALLGWARLITIAGPGGIGKSRLVLALAQRLAGAYDAGGLFYASLLPISDARHLPVTLLRAVEAGEQAGRSVLTALIDKLRDRRSLLVVDNCEHLLPACAHIFAELLQGCPKLQIVCTSRIVLRVAGEAVFRLSSLTQADGVKLFTDRASAVSQNFALTPDNTPVVARLVRRLDGMPLAIELAATRLNVMSLELLEARLRDLVLPIAPGAGADGMATQSRNPLNATLSWSFDMLLDAEQRLFARLSIFPGDWTIAHAEAVCDGDGIERHQIVDLLCSLIDNSLIVAETVGETKRLRYLDAVRRYARTKVSPGEDAHLRSAVVQWAVSLGEQLEPRLYGSEQLTAMRAIEREIANFRLALRLAAEPDASPEVGLRLVAALAHFWLLRNDFSEGIAALETALARDRSGNTAIRVKALVGLGMLSLQRRDFVRACSAAQEAAQLARLCSDGQSISHALGIAAIAAVFLAEAERFTLVQSELWERCRQPEHPWIVALAHYAQALVAVRDGEHGVALGLLERALDIVTALGDMYDMLTVSIQLAYALILVGDISGAARRFFLSTSYAVPFKNTGVVAQCTLGLACVATALNEPAAAAELFGAADALLERSAALLWHHWGALAELSRNKVKAQLGEAGFTAAFTAGFVTARHDMYAVIRRFEHAAPGQI